MAKRSKLPKGYFWRWNTIWCRTDPVTGKAASTGIGDRKGLAEWQRTREAQSSDPRYAAAHKTTLGDAVNEILAIKRAGKSEATVSIYRHKLGIFVTRWGKDLPLIEITPDRCDAYAKQRFEDGAASLTLCKEFSALSQMLKAQARRGRYPHDIATLRPLTVVPHYVPRERHLSWQEFELLREECGSKLDALIVVIVATGARLSEALRFAPTDLVDFVAHLRGTKTEGADRYVPVLIHFRPMLESVISRLPILQYRNNLRRDLLAACKRAGIEACTPNDLRRTHASLLVAAGVDKDVVRRMLGHKTSRMVEMVYGKVDPKELEKLAERAIGPRLLGDGNVTGSVTGSHFATTFEGQQSKNLGKTGANSGTRTPDLRFTKPKTVQRAVKQEAENPVNGHVSTLAETQPDTATPVTGSVTGEVRPGLYYHGNGQWSHVRPGVAA